MEKNPKKNTPSNKNKRKKQGGVCTEYGTVEWSTAQKVATAVFNC